MEAIGTLVGGIALTILDVVMPKMGGKEAADKIRSLAASAPILFSTGYDQANVLDKEIISTSCDVVNKPYTMVELSHKIRNLIN